MDYSFKNGNDWVNIVNRYIEIRTENNVTQSALSEMAETMRQEIYSIEKKGRCPSVAVMMKLLKPLGYTLSITPIETVQDQELRTQLIEECVAVNEKLIKGGRSRVSTQTRDRVKKYKKLLEK